MAFSKIAINAQSWTLIGNNVTKITFENIGQPQIWINVTATNTAPTETVGLAYDCFNGEILVDPKTLTISAGQYVWARTFTGSGAVVVDV